MKRFSPFLVVIVLLPVGMCLAQQPQDTAARVDALVQEFMKEEPVPALTVAIGMDGRIVYSKGFGQADRTFRQSTGVQHGNAWSAGQEDRGRGDGEHR